MICPKCTSEMKEVEPDHYECSACLTKLEQLNLFEGDNGEQTH